MNRAKNILLTAGLALVPLSTTFAAGWAPPANKPASVPEDLGKVIVNTTNWILGFVSLIAVLAIIWGGVQYLTSIGNEDTTRNAKRTITYALLGLAIAGMAYAIVNVLVSSIITDGGRGGTAITNPAGSSAGTVTGGM